MKLSHHPATFGGHRHFGSGDMMVSIYHVTLQDHVSKALNGFLVRSLSGYVIILPGVMAIGIMVVKI